MTTEELKQLAAQLRHPEGEYGISVSEMMNETNSTMTRDAITRMELSDHDHILELGHGNGAHIPYIMEQANELKYTGLELSGLMHAQAQKINSNLLSVTDFRLYDGGLFPFAADSFDKAFTVNTIYFWPEPLHTLSELYRVLKPGATLCITYSEESFMKQLPFTEFGFTLYSRESLTKLIGNTPFTIKGMHSQTELIKSKTGEQVQREFTTLSMMK